MFKASNSEAFIAVTHFLFDLLDKAESVSRFRNAWPIYEKKQESLYRRVALEWFKEIVTVNPNFFSRNFKVEQLQGLVVNPYGDRFIKFINGFVNFVIHQVSITEGDMSDSMLLPPVFTGNPEVTKRQGLIRGKRIDELKQQIKSCEVQRTRELMNINELTTKIKKIEKENAQELLQRKAAVTKLIEIQPDIFPDDATVMLTEEADFIRKEFKMIPIADHQKAFHEIQTPICKYVHTKWVEEVMALGHNVEALIDFFQKNSRLYTMLLASAQKRIYLDVFDLVLPQELKEKEDLSISDILTFYGDVAKMCFNQVNKAVVSTEIINRKKNLENKLNSLNKRSQDIGTMDNINKADLKKEIDFELQKLSIKLENAHWSEFSEFHGMQFSSLFKFSPPRLVDTTKVTGLTPAVSGYLPEIAPIQNVLDTLNQSRYSEILQKSRNDNLGDRSFKQISILRHSREHITSVTTARQDICDSPVSHIPSKTIEPLVLLHPRNSRRSSLSTFRLSLPPSIEDDEHFESDGVSSNTLGNRALIEENETVQAAEADTTERLVTDSLDRMDELRKCFASASTETPMEQPLSKAKVRRRSSLNLKGKKLLDSTFNESSIEDLEGILGIMDVTLSYGDFLDVSIDCDEVAVL
ncbi:unnamed protein product [Allacma fusca]|uniref:HAUS augmin-like complex subunit 6 N-terminal domain-containing protein n=1 Tax=Allacma fusca TaxID=39272 RepID=A0A8J2JPG5_9HEXA|nr:unnamed protein product [Allacma fusca]